MSGDLQHVPVNPCSRLSSGEGITLKTSLFTLRWAASSPHRPWAASSTAGPFGDFPGGAACDAASAGFVLAAAQVPSHAAGVVDLSQSSNSDLDPGVSRTKH